MSLINVSNLTFCYEGSYDNIFENVSFQLDTNWKLGFIGRNGKGKTTFLNLLLGKYQYQGSISTSTHFDYFPYSVNSKDMSKLAIDVIEKISPDYELWKICRELDELNLNSELLYQPYETLSHGERTKIMLSLLFSQENCFLLIDEPTNHLDMATRKLLSRYLSAKTGFILISHDRNFLDECVDHVLVLNRNTITVEKGNFSSWWENKKRQDQYEIATNDKLKREIGKLEEAAKRNAIWAEKSENRKIGFDPVKEHDRSIATRSYMAAKSKRMQQQRKNIEHRSDSAISQKENLLKDLETPVKLKLMPLSFHKDRYVQCENLSISYETASGDTKKIIDSLNMEIKRGDRIHLQGKNGCGKSSIIKSILTCDNIQVLNQIPPDTKNEHRITSGSLSVASGLIISYISQDTSYLHGKLDPYIEKNHLDSTIFKAVLRQLDLERIQFEKSMDDYSEGQKKKVLIATSLTSQAHLYIWDEPLNYIDIFSRMQLEEMLLSFSPTMLFVEHDKSFSEKIATKVVAL